MSGAGLYGLAPVDRLANVRAAQPIRKAEPMPEVRYTAELDRILGLPRRAQAVDPAHVVELTDTLRTEVGRMGLRDVQALALLEAMTVGGVFGAIGVGEGKTLITLLLPYVLEAASPLLLLPANLIEKTRRDHARYAEHFRLPRLGELTILSYELLGRVQAEQTLARVAPDLIIADEVHKLKNRRAACTRRVLRYMDHAPATKFVALSGTVMQKSVRDFSHIIRWCLKDGAPLPRTVNETEEWALALDEKVADETRFQPGALLRLCEPADHAGADAITAARRGFRRRLVETPGVVSTVGDGERVDCSIYVSAVKPTYKPITDELFKSLRETMQTPDGEEIISGAQLWATARQLALGFHYVRVEKRAYQAWRAANTRRDASPFLLTMVPEYRAKFDAFLPSARPPKPWVDAKRTWSAFARDVLSRSRTLDSEHHVALAVDAGKFDDGGALARWRAIRDTFQAETVAVWHDDSMLRFCKDWLANNANGIVWTNHHFFGGGLAAYSGRPYYGAEGLDARGLFIDDAEGAIIASIDANKEGRNLQYKWSRNLITAFPDTADRAEQLIGRTHRSPGQTADEVTLEIILGCREHANAFRKAMSGAQTIRDTVGAAQKLLIADVTDWPSEDELSSWRGPRWVKQNCADEM